MKLPTCKNLVQWVAKKNNYSIGIVEGIVK
jgi:hypothetical protein